MRDWAALAALLTVTVLSSPSKAQDARPAAQPTFRAEVNLVEVVAVVTGKDDRSLGDLAASDFEVLEDGSVRTLVSIRKLAAESRETVTAATSPTAPPAYVERLPTSTASADAPAFVLLLDDLDTSPRDSHRVIRAGSTTSYRPRSARGCVPTWGSTASASVDLTLQRSADLDIFHAAREAGGLVMTKDADFAELVYQFGAPPQIVLVTCGNTSNVHLRQVLASAWPTVGVMLERGEPLVEVGDRPR